MTLNFEVTGSDRSDLDRKIQQHLAQFGCPDAAPHVSVYPNPDLRERSLADSYWKAYVIVRNA